MANRKDTKGRNLREGESQRSDGRYQYRYTDSGGVRRTVYSWKLVETDKLPKGKKNTPALRTMEHDIQCDIDYGIDVSTAQHMTLNEYANDYLANKVEIKASTLEVYKCYYANYVRDDALGSKLLSRIRYSDIKKLYLRLMYCKTSKAPNGLKPNSILLLNAVLHPIFQLAVKDHIIRDNPTEGVIGELRKSPYWETEKKHALTIDEQSIFIDFVKSNPQFRFWLPLFTFLLGTGCRIGEAASLTWADVDFSRGEISINHTLQKYTNPETGNKEFHISKPKTKTSIRWIPMLSDVRKALLQERRRQMDEGFCQIEVDGYKGFVFMTPRCELLFHSNVDRVINRIVEVYNNQEIAEAANEGRRPNQLPHISAHIFRHTFATRFCENESNIKAIQEIMGHSRISTTMDIYAEATTTQKKASMKALEGRIKIS